MAFKEHMEFLPPKSPDAKIWRYMDLAKFLFLLDRSCLYFTRVDTLSEFDPFEGYYTHRNLDFDNLKFEQLSEKFKESSGLKNKKLFEQVVRANKSLRNFVKNERSTTYVNSWHIKEHESAAMWKIYLNSNEGIAIQSTYRRLIASLSSYSDFDIFIGKIKYIDYEKEEIPHGNLLSPFMYKRKNFEHEDELRSLIWTRQGGKNPQGDKFLAEFGLYVQTDIQLLIENIFVVPSAPPWILEIIRSVTNKFGLSKEVRQSNLASTPVY